MRDLSVKHRSERCAVWANCLAPGLGFYYLGLRKQAWWSLLLAALPWFIILLLPWHDYPWLPLLALLVSLSVLFISMWRARTETRHRSPMILHAQQSWPYYLLFSLSSLCLVLLWLWMLSLKSGLMPYQVPVNSMAGTINKYDWLLITRQAPEPESLQRGDVVLFTHPEHGEMDIQRIVGLPGERLTVHGGGLFVDGLWQAELYLDDLRNQRKLPEGVVETTVPEEAVFVLADNRDASRDSRYWGALAITNIHSKLAYRLKHGPDDGLELLRAYLGHSLTQ
jgi:signal peptidase I